MTSRNLYCCLLALIAIAAVGGQVALVWHGADASDGIIAIGAVALGALATMALGVRDEIGDERDSWVIEEEVRRELRRQLPSDLAERTITPREDTGTWPAAKET